ncbi:MAG: methyl-accepting chemotaxis protein [Desulfomicrobium escambiense]|nr:methyl-accepting chemotaxis protein [Desulfomicrobium escambiense]
MEQDVRRLTTAIAELDNQSRSIGSIIESISDIADHTGLLSLNAFIEAARAGAHGAGFGVIANEIRQLSQESARAAQEIKDSLSGISNLIQETVDAVTRVEEVLRQASMAITKPLQPCNRSVSSMDFFTPTSNRSSVRLVTRRRLWLLSLTMWHRLQPSVKRGRTIAANSLNWQTKSRPSPNSNCWQPASSSSRSTARPRQPSLPLPTPPRFRAWATALTNPCNSTCVPCRILN